VKLAAASLGALVALSLAGLAAGASTVARLRVLPVSVIAGNAITVKGTGFRPRLRVTLRMRRPQGSRGIFLGRVRASRSGSFRFVKTIPRSTGRGLWVLVACQRSCATGATARFRVTRIRQL
jgi:hypothetical protein